MFFRFVSSAQNHKENKSRHIFKTGEKRFSDTKTQEGEVSDAILIFAKRYPNPNTRSSLILPGFIILLCTVSGVAAHILRPTKTELNQH